jgi:hypothetical protein
MAMITGAHSIIFSTDYEADRAFLRDVLSLPNVDVGGGWLIFGLPPAEVAVHPAEESNSHELYLMCDDVQELMGKMETQGISCTPVQNQGWGLLTQLTLPSGSKLGVYEPRHARPEPLNTARPARKAASRPAKKKSAKKTAKKSAKKSSRKVAKAKPKPKARKR